MQRQSLGSPTSNLHNHGREESSVAEDQKRRAIIDYDERKDTKPRRLSFSPSSSPTSSLTSPPKLEKLIHLIPVLILLCFLVLYLASHTPSQSDLAHFNGFRHPSKHLDSSEISDVGGNIEYRRGDVLAIRSLRNLQELQKYVPKSRPHRKLADF